MEKVTLNQGTSREEVDYHAEVPTWRAPVIVGEVVKAGVAYYKGKNGKLYIKTLYDAMFKAVKSEIKDKDYKGVNPGLKY